MIISIQEPKPKKALEGCVLVFQGGEWKCLKKEAYFEPLMREIKTLVAENGKLRAEFAALKEEVRASIEAQNEEIKSQKAKINAKLEEYHDAIKEIIDDE